MASIKQPPKADDCPICFLLLPSMNNGNAFMACCGKFICAGCMCAWRKKGRNSFTCPHCRAEMPKNRGRDIKLLNKRVESNDGNAMSVLDDVVKDRAKGMKLLLRASELGSVFANTELAIMYKKGKYVA